MSRFFAKLGRGSTSDSEAKQVSSGPRAASASTSTPPSNRRLFIESGTFVIPAGVERLRVLAMGAGGSSLLPTDAAGQAGSVVFGEVEVTPGQKVTVTVGRAVQRAAVKGIALRVDGEPSSILGVSAAGGVGSATVTISPRAKETKSLERRPSLSVRAPNFAQFKHTSFSAAPVPASSTATDREIGAPGVVPRGYKVPDAHACQPNTETSGQGFGAGGGSGQRGAGGFIYVEWD